jgi:hypothetical protein
MATVILMQAGGGLLILEKEMASAVKNCLLINLL